MVHLLRSTSRFHGPGINPSVRAELRPICHFWARAWGSRRGRIPLKFEAKFFRNGRFLNHLDDFGDCRDLSIFPIFPRRIPCDVSFALKSWNGQKKLSGPLAATTRPGNGGKSLEGGLSSITPLAFSITQW